MHSFVSVIFAILLVWVAKLLLDTLIRSERRPRYPPGPKPKPLIGNIFDLPIIDAARVYEEWGKRFNSFIVYAEALSNHIVVVNSREDAELMMEAPKKARVYSDRPTIPIVKLLGWEYNFAGLRYGEEWRWHRKICQQRFNSQAARSYEPLQTAKLKTFLKGLLNSPKDFEVHNKMFSISFVMDMMFGYEVKSLEERCIAVTEEAIALGVKLLLPGASLLTIFPILVHIPAWFPGASSRKKIAGVKRLTEEMKKIPMDYVKKCFEEGTVKPSLVTDFYEKKYTVGASKEEEEVITNVAFTVYGGATDTTISSTSTFFYAMAISLDVQRKAQAEIDRVVGQTRLPNLADRSSLPYIEAIYRELMRFRPPLPLGVVHVTCEDDVYKGYSIPKGAMVFANIWAMTHDENIYENPLKFDPERFFNERGELNDDDRVLAYGFGRRACVGKYVASSTMWLIIASMLACFTIGKARDEDGNEIEINHDYLDMGLLDHKKEFQCSFTVRSPAAMKLIVDEA